MPQTSQVIDRPKHLENDRTNPALTIGQSQAIFHALGDITATQVECYVYELTWKGFFIGKVHRNAQGFWCGLGAPMTLAEASHTVLMGYLDTVRRDSNASIEQVAERFNDATANR